MPRSRKAVTQPKPAPKPKKQARPAPAHKKQAHKQVKPAKPRSGIMTAVAKPAVVLRNIHKSPLHCAAYWDAISHRVPPHIATTYGNFTCVNSVSRFPMTIPAATYVQMIFVWTPSATRSFVWFSNNLNLNTSQFGAWQQTQLNSTNTVPLDIRPLRMSVKVRNTTAVLSQGGAVQIVQVPQSVNLTFTSNYNTIDSSSINNLWNLAANNPDSKVLSGGALRENHTLVCAPSAFQAYNSYFDWVPLPASLQGANIDFATWQSLFGCGPKFASGPGTYAWPYTTTNGAFGEIPTNYITLVNFEPFSAAQTYEFEVFCQDGVRYPATSANAAVKHVTSSDPNHVLSDAQVHATTASASSGFVQPTGDVTAAADGIKVALESGIGALAAPKVARWGRGAFNALRSALTTPGALAAEGEAAEMLALL